MQNLFVQLCIVNYGELTIGHFKVLPMSAKCPVRDVKTSGNAVPVHPSASQVLYLATSYVKSAMHSLMFVTKLTMVHGLTISYKQLLPSDLTLVTFQYQTQMSLIL